MGRNRFGACGLALVLLAGARVGSLAADAPLADAAEKADRAGVRALLEQRVDVNQAQVDGMTALHWAAYHDDLETAKLLVNAKADVKAANRYGVTPLSLACTNGNEAMVELLLDAGADPNTQAPRRRDGPDDRRAHREARAREGAARPRGRRQRQGTARADGPDVGGGRGTCGGRRGAPRGGGRFPHARCPPGSRPCSSPCARAGPTSSAILLKAGADVNEAMQPKRSSGRAPARGTTPLDPGRRERPLRAGRRPAGGGRRPERPAIGLHGAPHADLGPQAEPGRRRERRPRPDRLREPEQPPARREARGARGGRQRAAQAGRIGARRPQPGRRDAISAGRHDGRRPAHADARQARRRPAAAERPALHAR